MSFLQSLFGRPADPPEAPASGVVDATSKRRESVIATDEEFLEAMYWIVLGRPLDDEWRKTRMRHFELGQSRDSMLQAALGSSEFR